MNINETHFLHSVASVARKAVALQFNLNTNNDIWVLSRPGFTYSFNKEHSMRDIECFLQGYEARTLEVQSAERSAKTSATQQEEAA